MTIVGVLPPAVDFSLLGVDVLVPQRFSDTERRERRSHNDYVVARLRDGVTRAAANAEMATIVSALTQSYPQDLTKWGAFVAGMRDDNVRVARPLLLVLMAVAALVLVIACAISPTFNSSVPPAAAANWRFAPRLAPGSAG